MSDPRTQIVNVSLFCQLPAQTFENYSFQQVCVCKWLIPELKSWMCSFFQLRHLKNQSFQQVCVCKWLIPELKSLFCQLPTQTCLKYFKEFKSDVPYGPKILLTFLVPEFLRTAPWPQNRKLLSRKKNKNQLIWATLLCTIFIDGDTKSIYLWVNLFAELLRFC